MLRAERARLAGFLGYKVWKAIGGSEVLHFATAPCSRRRSSVTANQFCECEETPRRRPCPEKICRLDRCTASSRVAKGQQISQGSGKRGYRSQVAARGLADLTELFERAFADFEAAISSPQSKAVARHWREAALPGKLPTWSDLRPARIKAQLPMVWCYNYDVETDDFIGRIAGNAIIGISGIQFKGSKLSQLRPVDRYPRSLDRARRVLHEPALYRGLGLVYRSSESCGFGERISMPLAGDGQSQPGIFGAPEFKSLAEWQNIGPNTEGEEESWFSLAGCCNVAAATKAVARRQG